MNSVKTLIITLVFANTSANAQTLNFGDALETRFDTSASILEDAFLTIDDDLIGIFSYPFDNPETTGLFLLGIGALVLADVPLTSFYQDEIEPVFEDFSLPTVDVPDQMSFLSNESRFLVAGLAGSYVLGVALNDERSQTAAVLAGKAVAYSYLTSHVLLKSAIGRNRPVQNLSSFEGDPEEFTTDPLDFGNYHGVSFNSAAYGTAMPSFHVTQYFAVARVYSGIYDNYAVPYGLAGVLFASNIRGHKHWVSDMVAGALIGTAIGEIVLGGYSKNRQASLTFEPYTVDDGAGIYISKSF